MSYRLQRSKEDRIVRHDPQDPFLCGNVDMPLLSSNQITNYIICDNQLTKNISKWEGISSQVEYRNDDRCNMVDY